jgi:hypothetical protein
MVITHWPLLAVSDLTRDCRWSTYDESVLKLSKVPKFYSGGNAHARDTSKATITIKTRRAGSFSSS